jgi:hypothetical protein
MIRNAERTVLVGQQSKNFFRIPTWVAEFETVAASPLEKREERGKSSRIRLEMRRQLKEHRASLFAGPPASSAASCLSGPQGRYGRATLPEEKGGRMKLATLPQVHGHRARLSAEELDPD